MYTYKLMLYAGQDGFVEVAFCQVNPDGERIQRVLFVGPWVHVVEFLGEAPFTLGHVHVKVSA